MPSLVPRSSIQRPHLELMLLKLVSHPIVIASRLVVYLTLKNALLLALHPLKY